jgi:hypothetical protein
MAICETYGPLGRPPGAKLIHRLRTKETPASRATQPHFTAHRGVLISGYRNSSGKCFLRRPDGRNGSHVKKHLVRMEPLYWRGGEQGRGLLLDKMEEATGMHRKGLMRLCPEDQPGANTVAWAEEANCGRGRKM